MSGLKVSQSRIVEIRELNCKVDYVVIVREGSNLEGLIKNLYRCIRHLVDDCSSLFCLRSLVRSSFCVYVSHVYLRVLSG